MRICIYYCYNSNITHYNSGNPGIFHIKPNFAAKTVIYALLQTLTDQFMAKHKSIFSIIHSPQIHIFTPHQSESCKNGSNENYPRN